MKLTQRPHDINEFAGEIHDARIAWWIYDETGKSVDRTPSDVFMAVHCSLFECWEEVRKHQCNVRLPLSNDAEVRLAEVVISLLDFSAAYDFNISMEKFSDCMVTCSTDELFEIMSLIYEVWRCYDAIEPTVLGCRIGAVVNRIELFARACGFDLWGAVDKQRKDRLEEDAIVADRAE
jgi:hypothetical protein